MNTYRKVTSIVLTLAALGLSTMAAAQTTETSRRTVLFDWDSGSHDAVASSRGTSPEPAMLAMSEIISVAGVPWMQLRFHSGRLGSNSRIEIISLEDGYTQVLDAESFPRWNSLSAYFNGDAVEIRLFVGPQDRDVRVRVSEVVVGEWGLATQKTICDGDDRNPLTDLRVGRLEPKGCTAFMINNGMFLTAGHCLLDPNEATHVAFRDVQAEPLGPPAPVVISDSALRIDQDSFVYIHESLEDWGIFTLENATDTEAMLNDVNVLFFTPSQDFLSASTVRVTGFGIDNDTPHLNKTRQTDTGPMTAGLFRYRVDTGDGGGNSGSPVVDVDRPGEVLGIHTQGNCGANGTGFNTGTSFSESERLWAAIDIDGSVPRLTSGRAVTGLSSRDIEEHFFKLEVPHGVEAVRFKLSGGPDNSGDVALYVRFEKLATTVHYDEKSASGESDPIVETIVIDDDLKVGTYHVMVGDGLGDFTGPGSYDDVSLTAVFIGTPGGGSCSVSSKKSCRFPVFYPLIP